MKKYIHFFLVLALFYFLSGRIWGQNTDCLSAEIIAPLGAGVACGSTVGSLATFPNISGCGRNTRLGFYNFTATATSHTVRVTGNSGFDPMLTIWDDCVGSNVLASCLDATGQGGTESRVLTGLTIGNPYIIFVRNFRVISDDLLANNGFTICITTPPLPPTNDDCVNAISVTHQAAGSCTTISGTVAGATQSIAACIGSGTTDVWYSFEATSTSAIINRNANFDSVLEVFSGICGSLTSLVCKDAETSTTVTGLTAGTTYFYRIYYYSSGNPTTPTFTTCVTTPIPPPSPPANDDCPNAISVIHQVGNSCTNTSGTVAGATQSIAACVGSGTTDVWYSFEATSTLAIINRNANFDSVLQIFSGTCNSRTSIICKDPETSTTITGLTVGTTYFYRIYYYFSGLPANPTFTTCVTTPPPPPANDDCVGSILLTHEGFGNCTTRSGTVSSATRSLLGCTGTADDDVWFRFVATSATADIRVNWNEDEVVQVFSSSGDCSSLVSTNCQNTPQGSVLATSLTIGDTYFIRVYSFSSSLPTYPSFSICVTTTGTSINDLCNNSINIPHQTAGRCDLVAGTVATATETLSSCVGGISTVRDVWYNFTATSKTALIHRIASYNTVIEIFTDNDCDGLNSLNCYSGSNADLQLANLNIGSNYLLRIYPASNTLPIDPRFTICITTPSTITNQTCADAAPICGSDNISFQATTGGTAPAGNNYGCLSTRPAPAWFYFQVSTSGTLVFGLEASADVDYAIWGPYPTRAAATANCGALPAPISCSFSISKTESASLNNVIVGEIYIMLITNYANINQAINLTQIGGTGSTACSIVLGENLSDLYATNQNTQNTIHWEVPSTQNIKSFEVMKSKNINDFVSLGNVEAVSQQKKYQFIDKQADCGTHYYQLKFVGNNNSVNFSPIIHAKRNTEECDKSIIIYPNPFDNYVKVHVEDTKAQDISYTLEDMTGKIIQKSTIFYNNEDVNILTDNIPKGVYILQIIANQKIKRQKIVKN